MKIINENIDSKDTMRIKGVPFYISNKAKGSGAISAFKDRMYSCEDMLDDIKNMCFSSTNDSPLEIMNEEELSYTVDRLFEAHNLLKSIRDNCKEMYKYL